MEETFGPARPPQPVAAAATAKPLGDSVGNHERVRVLVETDQRSFKGYVHKPLRDRAFRLSDHLNTYGKDFLCLSDVQVTDRGQAYRAGEKREFVAISVASITYLTPITETE